MQCQLQWIFTWPMQSATAFPGYPWQYIATVNLLSIFFFYIYIYWKCSCVEQLIESWFKHFLWPKVIFPHMMEMHLASGWSWIRINLWKCFPCHHFIPFSTADLSVTLVASNKMALAIIHDSIWPYISILRMIILSSL